MTCDTIRRSLHRIQKISVDSHSAGEYVLKLSSLKLVRHLLPEFTYVRLFFTRFTCVACYSKNNLSRHKPLSSRADNDDNNGDIFKSLLILGSVSIHKFVNIY